MQRRGRSLPRSVVGGGGVRGSREASTSQTRGQVVENRAPEFGEATIFCRSSQKIPHGRANGREGESQTGVSARMRLGKSHSNGSAPTGEGFNGKCSQR